METRELRYFVAVAEELHFGRAAERLGIAQPPLSRAIRQLERRLGTTLLERTSRWVALTEAGEVLLREARTALDAVAAAERRTRRAGAAPHGRTPLVLASKAGAANELVAKLLDRYAAEPDAAPVDVVLCGPGEQSRMLREGLADVAVLHLPYDDVTGFDTEVLLTERQVVVLPAGHPLNARDRLCQSDLDDIEDLPAPRWPGRNGEYADGPGPAVRDTAQLLQLISLGRTYLVAPESVQAQLTGGVTARPIEDAPMVSTLLAWPPQSRSRDLAAFVRTASSL
ncbi:MAG TPA: LysR family transcriptional regulator [Nocardioides sp.]|nr:LysR family transcriptional regulator [Nocardioides sp.]